MVALLKSDIHTPEVLDWKGVHLLHAPGSSCSQKVRIFLNIKNIPWESHPIDLAANKNHEPWYLGINPRGLVPCLVHDGSVHIESNDIIEYLEAAFPEPSLIPHQRRERIHDLLRIEDDLHLDLRTLTFRFVIPTPPGEMKSKKALRQLRDHDGVIVGQPDPRKAKELAFWEAANANGITDDQVKCATMRFQKEFAILDRVLGHSRYMIGDTLTIIDIAWYVYGARLRLAGYPLEHHSNLVRWFDALDAKEEFHSEVTPPKSLSERIKQKQLKAKKAQQTLPDIVAI